MKFIITRTSDHGLDEKPCEKAEREIIQNDKSWGKYKGIDRNVWVVEINTLEDLLKFYVDNGRFIIDKNHINKKFYEIEIYDEYRD